MQVTAQLEEIKAQSADARALLMQSEAREAALRGELPLADGELAACEAALSMEQVEHKDTQAQLDKTQAEQRVESAIFEGRRWFGAARRSPEELLGALAGVVSWP